MRTWRIGQAAAAIRQVTGCERRNGGGVSADVGANVGHLLLRRDDCEFTGRSGRANLQRWCLATRLSHAALHRVQLGKTDRPSHERQLVLRQPGFCVSAELRAYR
jgi:hypothetical protein